MQEGIRRMEIHGRDVAASHDSDHRHGREPSLSTYMPRQSPEPHPSPAHEAGPFEASQSGSAETRSPTDPPPSFSPFPKIKNESVPPADDEKEEILWNARKAVLHSQNVNMQIAWARDVLIWAEICMEDATREDKRSATPRIEHELRVDAINIINYLARQDHPDALYMQSKWLEFGKFGNRVDKRDAYAGYKRAAELGHGRSEYRMGMLFEQSNDMPRAKEHYGKGVALGDSAALYRLGMMSLLGQHGEAKDSARAVELIRAAASSADEDAPQASYVYGMLIGRDLPDISVPDGLLPHQPETAKMFVEKAAYLGFAKAQLKMGQAYELCQFACEFKPAFSLHYYALAAKQGVPEAALGVSRWFLFGYEGVFSKNEQLAFEYAQQAARAKLPTGAFAIGYYYEIGIHVAKDVAEAKRWYQVAADQGNTDAAGRLESLNQDRSLSKKDHETTTFTRIKSQHGSQRGSRPERFKQPPQQMPTLTESRSGPTTPVSEVHAPLTRPATSATPSPSVSPRLPPQSRAGEYAAQPEPSRSVPNLQPAPNARPDPGSKAAPMRPHSAAPYPDDDYPRGLDVGRSRSAAPNPADDGRGFAPAARRPPSARPPVGPAADQPMSAFGIRTPQAAAGARPMPTSQSTGNLTSAQRMHDPRNRVVSSGWEATKPAGHHQPDAGQGPAGALAPYSSYDQPQFARPVSAQPYPTGDRLQQQPLAARQSLGAGSGRGQPLPGAIPPAGTDPRSFARPPPDALPQYASGPRPQNFDRYGTPAAPSDRPDRLSSLPAQDRRRASGPSGGRVPSAAAGRHPGGASASVPPMAGDGGRASTVSPGQLPRLDLQPSSTATSAPASSKPSKGPATFEDMGIPHGKQDGDCVRPPHLISLPPPLTLLSFLE